MHRKKELLSRIILLVLIVGFIGILGRLIGQVGPTAKNNEVLMPKREVVKTVSAKLQKVDGETVETETETETRRKVMIEGVLGVGFEAKAETETEKVVTVETEKFETEVVETEVIETEVVETESVETEVTETEVTETEKAEVVETESESESEMQISDYGYDEEQAIALAQLMWAEARGCSEREQSLVAWTVLNRVDVEYDGRTDFWSILTEPDQFAYNCNNPFLKYEYNIAVDVLQRWAAEKNGVVDSGRTLPKGYLYYYGDGKHNYFSTDGQSDELWFGLGDPYAEKVGFCFAIMPDYR